MSRRVPALAFLLALAACSRADLDAITRPPDSDGGPDTDTNTDTGMDTDTGTPITCPTPALPPDNTMQTVQVGSVNRNYVLHVPAAYAGDMPVPLVVDFHALAGTGARQAQDSPFPSQTDPEGAIMAFPTGLGGPSGTGWNVGPCCVPIADDVAFVRALVTQVRMLACIDPKRIYATGFSMGGGMAHYIACHAADVFAAVAPIAFDLLQENAVGCLPARPISVISFRAPGDPLVPYDGGPSSVVPGMPVNFLGAQGTFQKWADLNRCTGSPSAADSNGCSTYSTCQSGVEVALCARQMVGQDPNDARIAWPFLKRHPLP